MQNTLPKLDRTKIDGTLKPDQQAFIAIAEDSIKTVDDVVYEIGSNSGDIYWDSKQKYGEIIVEYSKRNNEMRFRDYGRGMSQDKLLSSFSIWGKFSAEKDSRGLNSRGAKDCRVLGFIEVHTISDNKYSTFWIDDKDNFGNEHKGATVTKEIRDSLGLKKNGTVVNVKCADENKPKFPFPRFQDFCERLKYSYQLHGFVNEKARNKGSKFTMVNVDVEPNIKNVLETKEPANSEIVFDYKYKVPNYEEYEARFILKKTTHQCDDKIIVMSNDIASHEQSFLNRTFDENIFLENYYGYLICPGITALAREYKKDRKNDLKRNPTLVLDQNRQEGLIRSHPFTKALLQEPINKLREIIKKEEEIRSSKNVAITKELTQKTKEMEKLLAEILRGDAPSVPDPDYVETFGFRIYGPNNILTNQTEKYTIEIAEKNITNIKNPLINIHCPGLSKLIKIEDQIILQRHRDPERNKIFIGHFTISAFNQIGSGPIVFNENNKTVAKLSLTIKDNITFDFQQDIQFGSDSYRVEEGETKAIKLYAKHPEIVGDQLAVNITLDNNNIELTDTKKVYVLRHKKRSNYAVVSINVSGKYINQSSIITATLSTGKSAQTMVTVRKKNDKKSGPQIEFTSDKLNGNRAAWFDEQSTLKISTSHKETSKYYNHNDEKQSEPFWVLYTDIIADAFAQKQLTHNAKKDPQMFNEWTQGGLNAEDLGAKVTFKYLQLKKDILLKIMSKTLK